MFKLICKDSAKSWTRYRKVGAITKNKNEGTTRQQKIVSFDNNTYMMLQYFIRRNKLQKEISENMIRHNSLIVMKECLKSPNGADLTKNIQITMKEWFSLSPSISEQKKLFP